MRCGDRARYILPPGNYGGLPTTDESRDQLPLYDDLTPLRGNVTDADIDKYFLPEDFKPVGATREEPTGRPGTTILYDLLALDQARGLQFILCLDRKRRRLEQDASLPLPLSPVLPRLLR